jgi:hypothetical protein
LAILVSSFHHGKDPSAIDQVPITSCIARCSSHKHGE